MIRDILDRRLALGCNISVPPTSDQSAHRLPVVAERAPTPPECTVSIRSSYKAKYFHEFLGELVKDDNKGKVGVIEIASGMSARGIKIAVGRVASAEEGEDATVVSVKKVS